MARINLKGELVSDFDAELLRSCGFEYGFYSAMTVRSVVENLTAGEPLELDINSIGGLVDDASEIYALIHQARDSGHETIARIQSIAASAASYMALCCDRVEMALPAQMMIHNAKMGRYGNKFEFGHAAQELDEQDQAILDVYAAKCGERCAREQLEAWMNEETWLRASRCLEVGLVDAVIGGDNASATYQGMVASADNIVRAMSALPDLVKLRAQKNSADEWKTAAAAELKIERSRFK